jgi:hypothetical protein
MLGWRNQGLTVYLARQRSINAKAFVFTNTEGKLQGRGFPAASFSAEIDTSRR